MKTNYKLIMIAACLFTFSSCYDLNRFPSDNLSSGTFWKTQSHADQGLMGVYEILQNNAVFGTYFAFDCVADIGFSSSSDMYNDIAMGKTNSRTSTYKSKWKALYEGVARANTAIQNIPNVDMSDELKNRYLAEAKFLRGLYYFQLLDFFGGVPLYDETTIIEKDFNNMLKPRNSADEVRKFILDDLEVSLTYLPEAWEEVNKGRATKGAAIALKGKVLLYNKQYSEAAKCFELVKAKTDLYALYPDYAGLFKPGGDESKEMVFAIQNSGGVGQDYGMPMAFYMGTRSTYGSGWSQVMVATDFLDYYEYKDGKPFNWDNEFPGFNESDEVKKEVLVAELSENNKKVAKYPRYKDELVSMYGNRDPRMQATVLLPYTQYKGWTNNAPKDCEFVIVTSGNTTVANGMIETDGAYKTYLWRKFVPEYDMDGQLNNREDTPINFPIIRYADVLLMLAECYNEMGDGDAAVKLINEVRARVNMPGLNSGPTWLEANTKQEIFERIKHERAVEFAGEGLRYSDLRRWRCLEDLNGVGKQSLLGNPVYYTHVVTDRDYLWPIPGDEIDKNPSLEQNPGWD
ncbi:RagB/SusD family nutrient uptake outer membrane protein [Bacteroides sp. GD17]|jgi:tetratricopeptide (TPR) repeat protein|uniref:RagB/SusD family nutrient uptake outer membrane protein n=1 Tax=Bacteroides sp. GD17 TaxID=3139826 RepID=UPI0025E6B1DB|nr:RagB/SusD family nutrient uptake outer membrane protein [uncultured Bacteroides sp.]